MQFFAAPVGEESFPFVVAAASEKLLLAARAGIECLVYALHEIFRLLRFEAS